MKPQFNPLHPYDSLYNNIYVVIVNLLYLSVVNLDQNICIQTIITQKIKRYINIYFKKTLKDFMISIMVQLQEFSM